MTSKCEVSYFSDLRAPIRVHSRLSKIENTQRPIASSLSDPTNQTGDHFNAIVPCLYVVGRLSVFILVNVLFIVVLCNLRLCLPIFYVFRGLINVIVVYPSLFIYLFITSFRSVRFLGEFHYPNIILYLSTANRNGIKEHTIFTSSRHDFPGTVSTGAERIFTLAIRV